MAGAAILGVQAALPWEGQSRSAWLGLSRLAKTAHKADTNALGTVRHGHFIPLPSLMVATFHKVERARIQRRYSAWGCAMDGRGEDSVAFWMISIYVPVTNSAGRTGFAPDRATASLTLN